MSFYQKKNENLNIKIYNNSSKYKNLRLRYKYIRQDIMRKIKDIILLFILYR